MGFLSVDDATAGSGSGVTALAHQRHLMVANLFTVRRRSRPSSVRAEDPASCSRIECGIERCRELVFQTSFGDLSHYLDTTIEVAVHHVRAADPCLVDRAEMHDAGVLEEASDDRPNLDVLAQAGDTGFERTDAAYDDLDRNTGT